MDRCRGVREKSHDLPRVMPDVGNEQSRQTLVPVVGESPTWKTGAHA